MLCCILTIIKIQTHRFVTVNNVTLIDDVTIVDLLLLLTGGVDINVNHCTVSLD